MILMRKVILFFFLAFLLSYLLAFYTTGVQAKKKIIRRTSYGTVSVGNRLVIKPRLRNDRLALIINFSNLGAVSSFTYELSYTAEGVPQGVAGSITPSGENSLERELLFGTCSRNVCRYHRNIQGMKLVVTSILNSGVKVRKTFQIRP